MVEKLEDKGLCKSALLLNVVVRIYSHPDIISRIPLGEKANLC